MKSLSYVTSVPNKDNPEFFAGIKKLLELTDGFQILIGDFNTVMDISKDRIESQHNNTKSNMVLQEMCEELLMTEVWRAKNQDQRRYSWYKCKPKLSASRIDYAIIPTGLIDCCDNCGYLTGLNSDHLAFFLYLNVTKCERGRGYWKMNATYLTNACFIATMNDVLDEVERSCVGKGKMEKWEYAKFKIREESLQYARRRASETELIIAQLSEKICDMEQDLPNANLDILARTKTDLEDFMQEKMKSCIFRSRANFVEFGEKPSKYYLNLEKSRYNAKTCNALYDKHGKLITDTNGLLHIQEQFYRELYKRNEGIKFDLINTYGVEVPSSYVAENEQSFTIEEMGRAAKQLPNGKTSGNDGLPIEFYKMFWPRIKTMLFEAVMEAYETKRLYNSALLGVINLIP